MNNDTREEFLRRCKHEFETTIGYEISGYSREHHFVMSRMAFANVVLRYAKLVEVSRCMGKHHSSVCYYRINHEGNIKYYPLYRSQYAIALSVVDKISEEMGVCPMISKFGSTNLSQEIEHTKQTITYLQSVLNKMERKLASRGQVV